VSTTPEGYQTPKVDWQAADAVTAQDINRIEGNINAIETGSRTVDPGQAPAGVSGTLRQFLDWIVNRIKAILGTTNWYDAPPITLQETANIILGGISPFKNWQIFTSSGTFTVPTGITRLFVEVVGGGGGGAGSGTLSGNVGGGGGGGGYAARLITGLTPGAEIAVTVGSGGSGGSGGNGTTGGTSSFGAYLSATGGERGYRGSDYSAGGMGGAGSGGDFNAAGDCGASVARNCGFGGSGGGSVYGGGGIGAAGDSGGTSGQFYGGGGGGSCSPGGGTRNGGNGRAGVVIVRW